MHFYQFADSCKGHAPPPAETKHEVLGNRKHRPIVPPLFTFNVPQLLKDLPQWVNWFFKWKRKKGKGAEGKWDKPPIHRHGGTPHSRWGWASSTNPATWQDFESVALDAINSEDWTENDNRRIGAGFVLTAGDPVCVIDLDDCRNRDTGELTQQARDIISFFNTYTEISPSGTGVKLFLLGTKPGTDCKTPDGSIEVYDQKRYVTVTGDILDDSPAELRECQAELDAFCAQWFPPPPPPKPRLDSPSKARPALVLTDQDLIEKACNANDGGVFARLWSGDTSDCNNDDSRADFHLVKKLAFWVGDDPSRIESLMRQSGLVRAKWNRADYLPGTIAKGIAAWKANGSEQYDPKWRKFEDEELAGIDDSMIPQMLCAGGVRPKGGDGAESKPANLQWADLQGDAIAALFATAAEERRLTQLEAAQHLQYLKYAAPALECCSCPSQIHQFHLYIPGLSRLVALRCNKCYQCHRYLKEQHKASLRYRIGGEEEDKQFWRIDLPAGTTWGRRAYDTYVRSFAGRYAAIRTPDGGFLIIGCTPTSQDWNPCPLAQPIPRPEALAVGLAALDNASQGGRFIHTGREWKLPQMPEPETKQWAEGRALPPELHPDTVAEICEANRVEIIRRAVPIALKRRFIRQLYFKAPAGWNAERRDHFYFQLQQQEVLPWDPFGGHDEEDKEGVEDTEKEEKTGELRGEFQAAFT